MGSAMARTLLRGGLRTPVWDRSEGAAAALAGAGARVADSASAAVASADAVITMLPDADAVSSVIFGDAADAFADRAAWAQMGTIRVQATLQGADRLGQVRPEVRVRGAPVSGSMG